MDKLSVSPQTADTGSAETESPDEPQFGLLDVIEAFTAMRQQWRTQSRENRELAESIISTTQLLKNVEAIIDQKISTSADEDLRGMISLVVELDLSLQRAVNTVAEVGKSDSHATPLINQIDQQFQNLGFFKRWIVKGFHQDVIAQIKTAPSPMEPIMDGLQLVVSRLNRMMKEQNLVRVDPLGKPFDGESMKSIASVQSEDVLAGHVAEAITPIYYHRGQVIRFAEVRVAR